MRVVLVSRRFWPQAQEPERTLGRLVEQLVACGVQCTVLTARWEAHSPVRFDYRGAAVFRLPSPAHSLWGATRYLRAVKRWLRENGADCDLVCHSRLSRDLHGVQLAVADRRTPVLVRCEAAGDRGDVDASRRSPFARRITASIENVDAVIAVSEQVRQELLAAGVPASRIRLIENGAPIDPRRSPGMQARSRRLLHESHDLFGLPPQGGLALYIGPLLASQGVFELVKAWRQVVKARPTAVLWMIGEGADGPKLWQRILNAGLDHRIILPGSFDDLTDLLQAADLLVAPALEEHSTTIVAEAAGCRLPIVASDLPGFRTAAGPGAQLTPPGDIDALTTALEEGLAAGMRLGPAYAPPSLEAMGLEHRQLFEEVLSQSGRS
ncbi:glycosyltransferase family 4 protein [Lignipirellula cremea]|uniref:Teichuronic acid biosynthesis glycosyltransferase TuaC n=1 Tax=Lignipirellula cremea TaxID=2528010 RepID=A0A518E252_9BACT|nr:glycosyltransferase family 4 protein [Lignipirellula cremea]QDU98170.1 Putative teichuronic acid biosynthesis glycosyltransferase TuaC [Lignipirellula cremea]